MQKKKEESSSSESEEEVSLEELYKKLITYNNNLYKIDTLISVEKDEAKKESYRKLRNSLIQAINYQEEAIKLAEDDETATFNKERLRPEFVDRVSLLADYSRSAPCSTRKTNDGIWQKSTKYLLTSKCATCPESATTSQPRSTLCTSSCFRFLPLRSSNRAISAKVSILGSELTPKP